MSDRIRQLADRYEAADPAGREAIIADVSPEDAVPLAAELERRALAAQAEAGELRKGTP